MEPSSKVFEKFGFQVRPYELGDSPAVIEWSNLADPGNPRTVREYDQFYENREPHLYLERWVAPGELYALIGHNAWTHQEGRFVLDLKPRVASDRFADLIQAALERARELDATQLLIWTRDDSWQLPYYQAAGFVITEDIPVSQLILAEFDPGKFETNQTKLESEGIRFTSAAEMEAEGKDWRPELYEAAWEMSQDIPTPYPPTRESYDAFLKMMDSVNHHRPYMWFAMDGDRIVGYSRLYPAQADSRYWKTGMSGVVRSHRRRGIVSALKKIGATRAKADGAHSIRTENNSENPMLDINLRMGFRVTHKELFLELLLKS